MDDELTLTSATLRLAGDDLYAAVRETELPVNDLVDPSVARDHIDERLNRHATGEAHGAGGHPGADQAFRLAVVDAAFRPNLAFKDEDDPRKRYPSDEVRAELEELIRPTLRDGVAAADVVGAFELAHATGTRSQLPNQLFTMVNPEAQLFLTLECSVTGESTVVNGAEVTAMALFDYQETTMSLDALQGVTDPFNWPECNSAFKSITAIEDSYWESPVAHGIDILEVFAIPYLDFEACTPLSITYVDTPDQKAMIYTLSEANFDRGNKKVVVDRGFARAVDLGNGVRRAEALKVVHFDDDAVSNATSWFSCLWWDLMSVRTATLCPNRKVTTKAELQAKAKQDRPGLSTQRAPEPSSHDTTPGPLESLAQAWSDVVLQFAKESTGVATRTAKRWPPGEAVTGGKLTSDLIEGFERLTPPIGKGIDVWLRAIQHGLDQVVPNRSERGGQQ